MAREKLAEQIVVRMDNTLYEAVKAAAHKNGLSIAAWSRQVLIEKLGYPAGSKDEQTAEALCDKN